jgi:predicted unusual protein kinase regulating ubiquinone biosynthesis (AarF/ABC1/UbiB family)
MGLSFKPEHLKRYADIARLLVKYGRSDLVKSAGLDEILREDEASAEAPEASRAKDLAQDLERMGPTFVKLGQLLSTRTDFLPAAYTQALSRLQEDVEPFPGAEARRIIERELGARVSKAFREFDEGPIAGASLSQVHRAVMRDGREVAVKVQRPGIREQVLSDLEVLDELAEFFEAHAEAARRHGAVRMLEEVRKGLLRELDFRQEAQHLTILGDNLRDFERIVVPAPVEGFTTASVLTMAYIRGRKITAASPLTWLEHDGDALADELFRAYLKQVLVDGFFHADPHPGNVYLTDDGRLALLDLGMAARIPPRMRERLFQTLLAVSEGRGEDAADFAMRMGEPLEDFDKREYQRRISELVIQHLGLQVAQIEIGRLLLEITRISAEQGLRLPLELTLLGKMLLNLDQVGRVLDPEFDPNAAIRRHAAELMRRHVTRAASPAGLLGGLLEGKALVERLPAALNRMIDAVANNEVKLRVDAIDESRLMEGLQKIANRITLGLVLAALIVGAAMLMRVETSFRILGYPGLAMLCFMAAAGGGVWLALDILLHDRREKKRRP